MRTRVIRTIHPVGQGAFYSERFYDYLNGRQVFIVVYDCGSGDGFSIADCAEKEIDLFSKKAKKIDLLFVSHFHADHLNGITRLLNNGVEIKNLVLPYINPKHIESLKALHQMSADTHFDSMFINPIDLLGNSINDTRIIYVVSKKDGELFENIHYDYINVREEISEAYQEEYIDDHFVDINNLKYNNAQKAYFLKSGDKLLHNYWIYMPFTREDGTNDNDLKENIEALNKHISTLKEIHGDDWIKEKSNQESVQNMYFKIYKNINNTSMMVFSAPMSLKTNNSYRKNCFAEDIRCCRESCILPPSCLYTGDITLNKNVCNQIRNHLSQYYIGTLQIPHHGSRNGLCKNTDSFLYPNILPTTRYFLSCGVKNKYYHPHNETLLYLGSELHKLSLVMDIPNTKMVRQFILT